MDKSSKYKEYLSLTQYYLTCLIAFFMPLSQKVGPLLIACLVLCWLLNGNVKIYLENLMNKKLSLLFTSLYLLYIIGALYSSNKASAWFDIQAKSSILIFPLIFSTSKIISKENIFKLFLFFYAGIFSAIMIELFNATLIYINTSHVAFFYSELSIFMHPSYFAMYLIFAIASISYYLIEKPVTITGIRKYALLFLIFLFTFAIIILSSKAGIICAVIIELICLFYFVFREKNIIKFLVYGLSVSLLYFITIKYVVQHDFQRIAQAEQTLTENKYTELATAETNRVRIYIWEASLEVIKNNFLLGVGTGDIHESLNEEYEKRGMSGALKKNLNAHNQFIQTFIAIGITGFAVLILSFALPFFQQIKKRKFLIPVFILIVAFNCLFESILELQAGVIFYAFFNSLLLFSEQEL